ncbi:hypothetical protein [Fructobacillus parabroussonetiae]|uniref:Uncharacterized protein n=1 Tax=Fructobacillus parabroussonetiae TaxID=2713174 RepID=A0ABS5QVA6_9LACO|nr:hypothetical protein [Fructobacillus parabroussonetiae]MBS9337133.1 hypothetical protein [Fructobacillus parabroussonetiae]
MKRFIDQHLYWFLSVVIILAALNEYTPLVQNTTVSLAVSLFTAAYAVLLVLIVSAEHKSKK